MAGNTEPIFPNVLNTKLSQLTTANTNRDGVTGAYVTIFTPGANGSRVQKITITAAGTTTAGVVRLFWDDGTNNFLWKEIIVPAITPSTTVPVWSTILLFPGEAGVLVPSTALLKGSTHNSENFNVLVEAGNY